MNIEYIIWRVFISKLEMIGLLTIAYKHNNGLYDFSLKIDGNDANGNLYFKESPSEDLIKELNIYANQLTINNTNRSLIYCILYCIGAIVSNFILGVVCRINKIFA